MLALADIFTIHMFSITCNFKVHYGLAIKSPYEMFNRELIKLFKSLYDYEIYVHSNGTKHMTLADSVPFGDYLIILKKETDRKLEKYKRDDFIKFPMFGWEISADAHNMILLETDNEWQETALLIKSIILTRWINPVKGG